MVRFLDKEDSIDTVYNYKDSIILFPSAFALRPLKLQPSDEASWNKASNPGFCDSVLAVRQDHYDRELQKFNKLKVLTVFHPGPLESLLVKLNPRQNTRRGAIYLLKDTNCD
jgi:hypothetical protein